MENIALHSASTFQGAQFYLSCGQVQITNGGSGTPGPLVAIPGVYTGHVRSPISSTYGMEGSALTLRFQEPSIMLNIYYPIPKNYTNPGPVGLHLHRRFVWLTLFPGCLARIDDAASSVLVLMSHARLYIIAHSSALRSHSAIGRICTASSVLYNVIFIKSSSLLRHLV